MTTRDIRGHSALFLEDRCAGIAPDTSVVQLRLLDMRLCWPRQWGACWLAGQLWRELELDRPWADRLPRAAKARNGIRSAGAGLASADRAGQRVEAERRLVRQECRGSTCWRPTSDWQRRTSFTPAMTFCCGKCTKRICFHISWRVGATRSVRTSDVLLYDLTSTYFEINASEVAEGDKRRHEVAAATSGPDCPQVVIALVVTTGRSALGLRGAARQHGGLHDAADVQQDRAAAWRARRVRVMDRGIPTEAVLAEMRGSDPPVQYLVGTPKGRLSRLEKQLLTKPLAEKARAGVQVKLLAEDDELYEYAESVDRALARNARCAVANLKWLWDAWLRSWAAMEIPREEMLMKLGAARSRASPLHGAWSISRWTAESSMFVYTLNRQKLGWRSGGAKDAI